MTDIVVTGRRIKNDSGGYNYHLSREAGSQPTGISFVQEQQMSPQNDNEPQLQVSVGV